MAIFIGTSGFFYLHWRERFYPKNAKQPEWLSYYAELFDTVELNVSFYRLPSANAFQVWYDETPEDFSFSLKGSRYITHTKKLHDPEDAVKVFFDRAKILKDKLSVVLWQFSSSFETSPERLKKFLEILQRYGCRHAFEFRDESWFTDEIYGILKRYNAALVISDSPFFPKADVRTADFSYIRLHGAAELHSSEYFRKELKSWAEKVNNLAKKGDVYIYFNNDVNAYAVKNALEMKELL